MARHFFNLHEVKGVKFLLMRCVAEDMGFKVEATAEKGYSYEINCSKEDFEALIEVAKGQAK